MPKNHKVTYADQWEVSAVERFDKIIQVDLNILLRVNSPEFSFSTLKDKVEYVISTVMELASNYDYWQYLSDNKRQSVLTVLDDIIIQFNEMKGFDPKSPNPWELVQQTILNFNNRYNGFYDILAIPLQGYLGKKAYTRELAGEYGRQAKEGLAEIRRIKTEIEQAQQSVNQAAEAAGNVASTAYTTSFAEQAYEHKRSAKNWFIALIMGSIIGVLLALTIIYELVRNLEDESYTTESEAYILKLSILAFLYFGLRFLIRNYSANQHLYVINKQRANSLATMEAFRTSAINESAKDEILLAAVSTAYSHQESGFITTREGAGSDDGDILEVVRSAIRNK
jgi:hypothetical protein